ncbi:hypothetical protein [Elizabethkingia phage TCUEAP1]|nr:hypothetical protein [Elizabethkingia phage TCUEAP1]
MANTSVCAELTGKVDLSCARSLPKKYYQEAVIINKSDIDTVASKLGVSEGATCDYTVEMVLKAAKKGVQIRLPDSGSSIKGYFAKSKSDNGFVQYKHSVRIFLAGVSKETKCILDKLDRGSYVIAVQAMDGTVEIYGWENGMSTADYTYDLQEGGGGAQIELTSDDAAQESTLPLVYKASGTSTADADFNSQFEQP